MPEPPAWVFNVAVVSEMEDLSEVTLVVAPGLKSTTHDTSQSPAVREMLVTSAAVPVVSETAEAVATVAVTTSPTNPAAALSLVAVPILGLLPPKAARRDPSISSVLEDGEFEGEDFPARRGVAATINHDTPKIARAIRALEGLTKGGRANDKVRPDRGDIGVVPSNVDGDATQKLQIRDRASGIVRRHRQA